MSHWLLLHAAVTAGAGGLGDATLHHVYSESAGTGDITRAVRQGQIESQAATAAAAPAGRGNNRRRSSIGRHRPSFAAEPIPEEASTPASVLALASAAPRVAGHAAEDTTEDMAASPHHTAGLVHHNQQPEQETPVGEGGGAAAQDADGLTTNLLLDDRIAGGWGHVIGARAPGTTGRGSVGSNVLTMHGLVSEILCHIAAVLIK